MLMFVLFHEIEVCSVSCTNTSIRKKETPESLLKKIYLLINNIYIFILSLSGIFDTITKRGGSPLCSPFSPDPIIQGDTQNIGPVQGSF